MRGGARGAFFDKISLADKITKLGPLPLAAKGLETNVLLYGGAYIKCSTFVQEATLAKSLQVSDDIAGLPMEVKSWCASPSPLSVPRQLLRSGATIGAEGPQCLPEPGNCLVGSLRAATMAAFGIEVAADMRGNTVAEINGYEQIEGDVIRLVHADGSIADLLAGAEKVFLAHQFLGEGQGHFFALHVKAGGVVVVYDKDAGGLTITVSREEFIECWAGAENVTVFEACKCSAADPLPDDAPEYHLQGDGDSELRRTLTPLQRCLLCNRTLQVRNETTTAAVIICMAGAGRVPKRCTGRSCRVSYLYNYRWEQDRKRNTVSADDAEYIFVNSKVGFRRRSSSTTTPFNSAGF